MRYLPENGDERQLVGPLPVGAERIFDQSEITSKNMASVRRGPRRHCSTCPGLSCAWASDFVQDEAQQRLALTNAPVGAADLEYTTRRAYLQLSYDWAR